MQLTPAAGQFVAGVISVCDDLGRARPPITSLRPSNNEEQFRPASDDCCGLHPRIRWRLGRRRAILALSHDAAGTGTRHYP